MVDVRGLLDKLAENRLDDELDVTAPQQPELLLALLRTECVQPPARAARRIASAHSCTSSGSSPEIR